METSGILKTINGHVLYHVSSSEKYGEGIKMLLQTKTEDDKALLQLDSFDIFSLFKICQEYVQEVQMGAKKNDG